MRRSLAPLLILALCATLLVGIGGGVSTATPVAVDETTYQEFGRVFPDPHGCVKGLPLKSPWAKGNVCAVQFIQWDEAVSGLQFLEQRFPSLLQVIDLRTQFGDHPEFQDLDLRSAGLPLADLSRDRRDLYVIKVTNRNSSVPEPERLHFAYSLSIHGIERAGIEGGIRAIEDLVTWAACEDDSNAAPGCATEGPFPKRILEPTDSGPTAGEVLDGAVVYFVLSNPDGWHRGEVTQGGVFFQRYNGNGMDLNRDFPTIGYTEPQYTSASEPETRGYARYLSFVRDQTAAGRFDGAIDLHGMVDARAFSYTLLGAGQRDYAKNALSVETSILTFRDSERRLSWSPLIAPAEECPGPVPTPVNGGNLPMCSDQWGTVWDTISYQVTGSFGDWMDSPLGLDAIGIDNEMAYSHLAPNTAFEPDLEQLHIDGNKGLIYSQITALFAAQDPVFANDGGVAYVFDPDRTTNPGGGDAGGPGDLPTQDDIEVTQLTGIQAFDFEVKGIDDGFFNGGLTIEATFGNVSGISPNAAADLTLEYCGPPDHPGDPEGCRQVAHYFNQDSAYLQAGARIDLNDPRPGPYRISANPSRLLPTRFHINFSRADAYPEPTQAPYDVSRMDFFTALNGYAATGSELTAVPVDDILRKKRALNAFDTLVIAQDFMPGFVPDGTVVEPAGDPQASESFTFGPEAFVPGVGEAFYEFEVLPGFDNDRLVAEARWTLTSDYDVHVERFDPATGLWEDQGCTCAFVATSEATTVFQPEPGQWRVHLLNFAGLPQPEPIQGSVRFFADPAPAPTPESRYTAKQFSKYAGAVAQFAANGGNVVLTDEAIAALPFLGTGVAAEDVTGGFFYAGWMDFDDGLGPTYDRHALAADVDKEGTAEGMDTVDGQTFDNRHQTYEPTPLGYYVSQSGSQNSTCDVDRCDSPNWIVDQAAWEALGGTTAARTLVRESITAGSTSFTGTSLGELPFGAGVIRIAGGLLPDPTEANYHPYGLASYALTYTGYQVFENLIVWQRP